MNSDWMLLLDVLNSKARLQKLERVREAAQALADSGTLGHWNHKTIVRVDGERAIELGDALADLEEK